MNSGQDDRWHMLNLWRTRKPSSQSRGSNRVLNTLRSILCVPEVLQQQHNVVEHEEPSSNVLLRSKEGLVPRNWRSDYHSTITHFHNDPLSRKLLPYYSTSIFWQQSQAIIPQSHWLLPHCPGVTPSASQSQSQSNIPQSTGFWDSQSQSIIPQAPPTTTLHHPLTITNDILAADSCDKWHLKEFNLTVQLTGVDSS